MNSFFSLVNNYKILCHIYYRKLINDCEKENNQRKFIIFCYNINGCRSYYNYEMGKGLPTLQSKDLQV